MKEKYITVQLDGELHRALRIQAINAGITLKTHILNLLDAASKEDRENLT